MLHRRDRRVLIKMVCSFETWSAHRLKLWDPQSSVRVCEHQRVNLSDIQHSDFISGLSNILQNQDANHFLFMLTLIKNMMGFSFKVLK